jgi:YVTN family beta-propeller protein
MIFFERSFTKLFLSGLELIKKISVNPKSVYFFILYTSIPVGSGLQGLAINPNADKVYVTVSKPNSIYIIDGKDNTIPLNNTAGRILFNPKDHLIYHLSGSQLSIINAPTINENKKSDVIPVGLGPIDVTFDPKINKTYVANLGDNTVSVIDLKTYSVIGTIKVGTCQLV